jgi:hypothetical protein
MPKCRPNLKSKISKNLHKSQFFAQFSWNTIGLSDGNNSGRRFSLGFTLNSYELSSDCDYCYLAGESHKIEWPNGNNDADEYSIRGKRKTIGCGILLNPVNKLSIFFTFNGVLLGKIAVPVINGN